MFLWILSGIVPLIVVVSIALQLLSRRKDKYQRMIHSLFYRTQQPGAGAWGLGPWYYGAWDVGEKVNEARAAGQHNSAHRRSRRRSHRRKPHHHQH
jgi:hypothetical protein